MNISRSRGAKPNPQGGWVMIYVIGFVLVVAILLTSSLRIVGDLRGGANAAMIHEEVTAESANATRIMDALLRRELQHESPDPFNVITPSAVNTWLTMDPIGASSPFSITQITLPVRPAWFSSQSFVQDNPVLAVHELATVWHVAHDLPTPFDLRRTTSSSVTSTNVTWRPSIWEIPTGQVPFIALEQVDLSRFDFPVVVDGTVLAPYGFGASMFTRLTASNVLSSADLPASGIIATSASVRPGLTVGWAGNPYDLTQTSMSGSGVVSTSLQQIQERGLQLWWDGQTIQSSGVVPPGISVQSVSGERRLVLDLGLLPEVNALIDAAGPSDPTNEISAYTINCVGPQAMSRGIVIIGAGSQSRYRDAIITNGAIRFLGTHDSPLVAATSYGAVVFDHPSAGSPAWRLFLHAPLPSERITSSTSPATNGTRNITTAGAAGGISTSLIECSSAVLKLTASYDGVAPLKIGFAASTAASQPDLFLQVTPGVATTVWAADETGAAQQIDSIPWSGSGAVTVAFTYERVGHAVVTAVGSTISRTILPATIQPRFETAAVLWSTALSGLELSVRSGGTHLYAANAVQSPVLTGGLLIGSQLGGTLSSLSIQKDSGIEALPLTARFLFFCP